MKIDVKKEKAWLLGHGFEEKDRDGSKGIYVRRGNSYELRVRLPLFDDGGAVAICDFGGSRLCSKMMETSAQAVYDLFMSASSRQLSFNRGLEEINRDIYPKKEEPAEGGERKEEASPVKEEGDPVNRPAHYTSPVFVYPDAECIHVARNLSFSMGSCFKYIWRAGKKDPSKFRQDMLKAKWYYDDLRDGVDEPLHAAQEIMRLMLTRVLETKRITRRQLMLGLLVLKPFHSLMESLFDDVLHHTQERLDGEVVLTKEIRNALGSEMP